MNILILGATGRVGSQIASLAREDGHFVTLFVRSPEKVADPDEQVMIYTGNVLNQEDIARSMRGVDAVISALSTDGTTTLSTSMPILIEAMKVEGIKRIVTIGTAGILQSRDNPHLLRYQSAESKRKSTFAAEEHHSVFDLLQRSDLDWTIVCPSYLHEGESRDAYRVERNVLPEGGSAISIVDTAAFAYRQLASADYRNARVGIAY
ncbi:UNVERIFIED_CONTAM: putative NADH-flavin reductase [Brevibacillus sp. OAP136]